MAAPVQSAELTKFPKGISSFGMPQLGDLPATTGKVFFVDSTAALKGDDGSHGLDPLTPFATIDFAIGQCGANRGDTILVLPGHIETITSAAAINCDVAGIRIRGLGEGRSRPTITFSTSTAASIDFNAANVIFENLVLDLTGITGIIAAINFKSADTIFQHNELISALGANKVINVFTCTSTANRVHVIANYVHGLAAQQNSNGCLVLSTNDAFEFAWNRVEIACDSSGILSDNGSLSTNLNIHDNVIVNLSTSLGAGTCMKFTAASTGLISYNSVAQKSDPASTITDTTGGTLAFIENYGYDIRSGSLVNKIGILVPPVGSSLSSSRSLVDEIIGAQFSYNRHNYIAVTADFSSASWNTVAKHKLLDVTGLIRVRIIPECTIDLTSGGAAAIKLGDSSNTASFIASTTATAIDTGELWLTTTPSAVYLLSGLGTTPGVFIDAITNENDIGYEITVAAMTAGSITFHIWWEPVNLTGFASAGTGGVF